MVSLGRKALDFLKSNPKKKKKGVIWLKKKKKNRMKRELERGATDRERRRVVKRRGAEWRWLDGGAHSNEQVVGGREG